MFCYASSCRVLHYLFSWVCFNEFLACLCIWILISDSVHIDQLPISCQNQESEIAVESTQFPYGQWQLALLELADTHYAAICTKNDSSSEGESQSYPIIGFELRIIIFKILWSSCAENVSPMGLRVWKTIPLLEDVYMSGTDTVVTVSGLVKQIK